MFGKSLGNGSELEISENGSELKNAGVVER